MVLRPPDYRFKSDAAESRYADQHQTQSGAVCNARSVVHATHPFLITIFNCVTSRSLDHSKRTFSNSSLDTEVGNGRQNPSLTPPLQKIIFEKCHRSSRSMSQLRSIKSTLGSSLDQGLDKPVQSPALGSQSKRICKSEESAIDNKALVLAKDRSSNSSNETLNSAILNNIDNITLKDNNFADISDKVVIESNIEIMIPTSVSKSRNVADSLESSASARDRSSNSISSCEMALCSSQNDADEGSNDNHARREGNGDNILSADDGLRNAKDAIDGALKDGDERNSRNEASQSYDTSSTTISEQNNSVHERSLLGETAIYSRERFAKSCLSLDDMCTYEESERKQRTNSICSYPEEECAKDTASREERDDSKSR